MSENIFLSGKRRDLKKSDWKLFREKLPGWQETYMARLNLGID